MTTQPLAELNPVSDQESIAASGSRIEQHQGNSLLWGFVMMFIGVAIGVVGKKLLHADLVTVVGVLISLVGMFLTVYPFLSPARRRRNEPGPPSRPEVVISSQPANYLTQGGDTEYVPSITERTTGLLKNPTASEQRRKDDLGPNNLERTENYEEDPNPVLPDLTHLANDGFPGGSPTE